MGTIIIINKSSKLEDKGAAALAIDYWNDRSAVEQAMDELCVNVIKKGHTFKVVDAEENAEEAE